MSWNYTEADASNDPHYLIVISTSSTLQNAGTAGQTIVVSDGCVPGSQVNGGCDIGGNVAVGTDSYNTNITIPTSLTPGVTYYVIVAMRDYNLYMNPSVTVGPQNYASFVMPLPPPSCAATVLTEGVTAAPGGLYLFDVDYTFTNTGASNIVYNLPPNVTLQSAGPNAVTTASNVTWNFANITIPQSGVAWALLSVNPGTASGTVIPNSATLSGTGCSGSYGPANVTVQPPQLTLTKSQNTASLAGGSNITYSLAWTANGQNLEFYDSYSNAVSGTTTTGSPEPWGYDGTNYTVVPAAGDPGTWVASSDSTGQPLISGSVLFDGSGGSGRYPELLRNGPGVNICGDFIVEGDIEIPSSALGATSGGDAHMVLAASASQGITYEVAISQNNAPAYLFYQKNNNPIPGAADDNALAVNSGQWYTVRTEVQYAQGASGVTFTTYLWPTGNPAAAITFSYVDTSAPLPACSGGWVQGWRADETAGTDWFTNLKVFSPGPIINAVISDTVPTGMTYVGSSIPPSSTSPLVWDVPGAAFPTTMFNFISPITWWGTANCPGPTYVNQFAMSAADGVTVTTSNSVTLNVTGCGPTPTPTATPTPTVACAPGSNFLDTYPGSGSLTNYSYQDPNWNVSSASALGLAVTATGGELDEIPGSGASGSSVGAYMTVNNAQFTQSLSNYTVEGDFKLDAHTSGSGLFGLVFLEQASGQAYIFQWNGNPENGAVGNWQMEKQLAPGGGSYTYLGGYGFGQGVGSPAYTYGTWVHLKVVVSGGIFTASEQTESAPGVLTGLPVTIFNAVTDTTGSPYASGAVGIRSEIIDSPNTLHIANFHAYIPGCAGPTATPTNTATPTPTFSPTTTSTATPTATPSSTATPQPTATPSSTPTPQPTATFTPTPVGLHVWPNPFSTRYAVAVGPQNMPALQAYQVPLSAKMTIYTLSGELVNSLAAQSTGYIYWYGVNSGGTPVSPGIYYYVIQDGSQTLLTGKVLVLKD